MGDKSALVVAYRLEVWVDAPDQDPVLLINLRTAAPMPVPEVGQELDPEEWHQLFGMEPAALAAVVGTATNAQDRCAPASGRLYVTSVSGRYEREGAGLDRVQVLRVATNEAAPPSEPDQAEQQAWFEKRRADFLNAVLTEMAAACSGGLLKRCSEGVVAKMKASSAFGDSTQGRSAWSEAAAILQADGHPFAERVREDVRSMAVTEMAGLTLGERMALWIDREPTASPREIESLVREWSDKELEGFDPLRAYAGCMDKSEGLIQVAVLAALQDAAP